MANKAFLKKDAVIHEQSEGQYSSILRPLIIVTVFLVLGGWMRFFIGDVAVIMILLGIVALANKFLKNRFRIRPGEITIIWACYSFGLVSMGFIRPLLEIISYTSLNVLSGGKYKQVGDWVSSLLYLQDIEGVLPVYIGGEAVSWSLWIVPLIMWGLIFGAMMFLFFAMSSMFYQRWAVEEQLAFPMITPVATLIDIHSDRSTTDFDFKNRLVLLGVLIPVIISGISFLHSQWPAVPEIPLRFDVHSLFPGAVGHALSARHGTWFEVRPGWLGFAFLSSTDFAFTFWFFYVIKQSANIVFRSLGRLDDIIQFQDGQFVGGVFAIGLFMIWMNRGSIAGLIRTAFGNNKYDSKQYPMSPRMAVWGSIVAIVFLCVVGGSLLSIQSIVFLPFLLGLMIRGVTFSRVRADAAMPHDSFEVTVGGVMQSMFGTESFNRSSIVGMAFLDRHTTGWSFMSSMPSIMQGLKLGDRTNTKKSSMYIALGITFVIAFAVGSYFTLTTWYEYGIANAPAGWAGGNFGPVNMGRAVENTIQPVAGTALYTITGAVSALFMSAMRVRYIWWPFHPLGYLIAWELNIAFRYPGSFFLAWLIKVLGSRWFGGGFFMKAKPFFVAMILGDLGMAALTGLLKLLIAAL